MWWNTLLILAHGRQRQVISEFEASLDYKMRYLFKKKKMGVERWLSSSENMLFYQKTHIQFPAPIPGGS